MRLTSQLQLYVYSLVLVLSMLVPSAVASEIDACKYLVVTDFTADPYGIAQELRTQGRAKGFTVVSSARDVSDTDRLKTCVMAGSWRTGAFGVNVAVHVIDGLGEDIIGDAATATGGWTYRQAARSAARKIYEELGYKGYSEHAFHERMVRLYPPRPQLALSEAQIRVTEPRNALEGIWTDPENKYRLGIVKAPEGSAADYLAVILQSGSPIWQTNEIKAEIRTTASPRVFTCTYFMAKQETFRHYSPA